MGRFHALHSGLDPAQGMPPDHDFMGGEHQAQPLLRFLRVTPMILMTASLPSNAPAPSVSPFQTVAG